MVSVSIDAWHISPILATLSILFLPLHFLVYVILSGARQLSDVFVQLLSASHNFLYTWSFQRKIIFLVHKGHHKTAASVADFQWRSTKRSKLCFIMSWHRNRMSVPEHSPFYSITCLLWSSEWPSSATPFKSYLYLEINKRPTPLVPVVFLEL